MVGAARPIGKGPPSSRSPRVVTADLHDRETWGPPPDVEEDAVRRVVLELQSDLHGLVDDVRRGPIARIRAQGQDYLGELRLAFLRHHRRLSVHVRAEGGTDFSSRARTEVAELAEAFRVLALSRASKVNHEAWSPAVLTDAINRLLEQVPAVLRAPVEAETFARTGGSLLQRTQRLLLHADRLIRKASGDEPPQRDIELRSLLRHHFLRAEAEQLEGIAVLLVEADAHLERRAGSLFDGIVVSVERIVSELDELSEGLTRLRRQVEEELVLAEQEQAHFLEDMERRVESLLANGVKLAKAELPRIGTFELPNRRRSSARAEAQRHRARAVLLERLVAARKVTAGGYVLLGLGLELAAFRAKVRQILEVKILNLEHKARGRSHRQIERLRAELDQALEVLRQDEPAEAESEAAEPSDSSPPAANEPPNETPAEAETSDLEKVVADLDRVLKEAQAAAQKLIDQLTSEQELAETLDKVAREAGALTDFYRVPERRLAPAEWTIPEASKIIHVPFSRIVSTFVETDVAPELLGTAAKAVASLQPMLAAYSEVERVVRLGGGQLDGDDALVREVPELGQTRQILLAAFERARDQLRALEKPADGWSRDLARALRGAVGARLEALATHLSETGLAAAAEVAAERALAADDPGERVRVGIGNLRGLVERVSSRGTRRVRRAVGEDRIAGVRRALGLPRATEPASAGAPFGAPTERGAIPPFYRRLFAGQATWAGDVLEELQGALPSVKSATGRKPHGGVRTAAVLGLDGAGRRALLGALTRGERRSGPRRIAFTGPTSTRDMQDALRDISGDQLVVVTGFSWLGSAAPGGFEPVRAFTERVLADGGKNAFIVESDRLVWRWLSFAAPLRELFPDPVEAPALEPELLEQTLLARHRLSGLELEFRGPESEEQNRARFFADLHRASDGLIQIALAYWLAALAQVDEAAGRVVVGDLPPSPHDALRQLPEESLHPLFLVARQGWMSAPVLASALGRREAGAEATLARLAGLGLLDRPSPGVYTVRLHLAGALQAIFQERGWS